MLHGLSLRKLGAVMAILLLAPGAAQAAMLTVTGEVTYRERIALPPGAALRVRLLDLTAPDTPARVDVFAPIGRPGQVPLTFTLSFDDLALSAGNEHGLVAEIVAGTELWFRNEEPYRVDPRALSTEPIQIVTTFAGRIATSLPAEEASATSAATAGLLGVTWRATGIDGNPVLPNVDSTMLIEADRRVGGRGGCNSYFSQAEVTGSTIRFSAVAATRMACLSDESNAQETAFFAALEAARYWRLADTGLVLLDGDENEVVRFVAAAR